MRQGLGRARSIQCEQESAARVCTPMIELSRRGHQGRLPHLGLVRGDCSCIVINHYSVLLPSTVAIDHYRLPLEFNLLINY